MSSFFANRSQQNNEVPLKERNNSFFNSGNQKNEPFNLNKQKNSQDQNKSQFGK